MTIQSRMTEINQVSQSATELPGSYVKSRYYHVNSVRDDKPYQVKWRYSKEDGIVTLNTKLFSFEAKYFQFEHPANTCQTVCYQVLGAIKQCAKAEGKAISFCETFEDAVRLLNFGGQLVRIRNMGNGIIWAVVR